VNIGSFASQKKTKEQNVANRLPTTFKIKPQNSKMVE